MLMHGTTTVRIHIPSVTGHSAIKHLELIDLRRTIYDYMLSLVQSWSSNTPTRRFRDGLADCQLKKTNKKQTDMDLIRDLCIDLSYICIQYDRRLDQ